MFRSALACSIVFVALSNPAIASEGDSGFVIEDTSPYEPSSYGYCGYTSEQYREKVTQSKGNFEKHPSYVSGDAYATFRWVRHELVGKNDRVYTIRTSTRSKPGQKILTMSFSGHTGDFTIRGIRANVQKSTVTDYEDKIKKISHTYTYQITSAYGLSKEETIIYESELKGRVFQNLTELIDTFDELELINKLNAAGSDKYQEYLDFLENQRIEALKEVRRQNFLKSFIKARNSELEDIDDLMVVSKRHPVKYFLLTHKTNWTAAHGEFKSDLMSEEAANHYLNMVNLYLKLETPIGQVFASRSSDGYRVVFKRSEFIKIPANKIFY